MAKLIPAFKRNLVFKIILVILPVVFFILLELGLRLFGYGKNLRLFVKSENYPGYYEINKNINLRYFISVGKTSPTNDILLINKPDTCYRIFVLGESTTRGFPYQASTSFPRILYYRLQDAFPEKRIEVINLSASAINSYTFIDMMDEIFRQKPDAILVYGGHNEYYGALGVGSVDKGGNFHWVKKLRLKLVRYRTFQLLQNTIVKLGMLFTMDKVRLDATLMERIVGDKDIEIDSKAYLKGIEQFRTNLEELLEKSRREKVPVILSELVSNVKDLPPFKSVASADKPAAIDLYNEAKKLEASGNYTEAKKLYYRAKDLDVIRFRAPEAFNELLHELGDKYSHPVVPMKKIFEERSPNGLIGYNLILEHLHPNIEGTFLMADAFFNTMKENRFISESWDIAALQTSSYYRDNWGFTALDSLIGDLNVKFLMAGWPFQPENTRNTFAETYRYNGMVDSMAFHYITGGPSMRIEDEHIKLAAFYKRRGRPDLAYEEYYSLIKMHPYVSSLYYDATKYLITQHKYQDAFDLIHRIPNLEKDFHFYYMSGTLKVKLGRLNEAISELETAWRMFGKRENPLRVLLPLFVAYRDIGDEVNRERIYSLIKTYRPNFRIASADSDSLDLDEAVNKAIRDAYVLLKENKMEEAKAVLQQSLSMKESAEAHKLIGNICLVQNEREKGYSSLLMAHNLNPRDIEVTKNLFIISVLNNDFPLASLYLDKLRLLKFDPKAVARLEKLLADKQNKP
jgi:tetratricopeptide (TPR) repeat protein